jgi:hypothetical protein
VIRGLRSGGEEGEEEARSLAALVGLLPALLIVAAIALLAGAMRLHDFATVPGLTDTTDEYSFTWAGMQLLRGHAPAGATALASAYGGGQDVRLFGLSFHLVSPWLDHPPLFGLLPGAAELLSGFRSFVEISPSVMRLPSVVLGVVTVLLGYQVARRLLPPTGAVFAAFLLAVEPGLVLLSRPAMPEAALAPLLLLAVLLATPAIPETARPGSAGVGPAADRPPAGAALGALLAACLLAPLVGLDGVTVPAAATALLLSRGIRREAWLAAGAGVIGLLLWVAAGLLLDAGAFLRVLGDQLGGGGGLATALAFITGGLGAGRSWADAWYLFAWVALAYLTGNAKRRHRYRALLWPIAIHLVLVVPFLPTAALDSAGWYRLPTLPLLLIAAAAALYAAVREGQLLVPALGLATAGVWSLQGFFHPGFRPGAATVLILLAAGTLPMAVSELRSRGAFRDAALGIWAVLALVILAGDTLLAWNLGALSS